MKAFWLDSDKDRNAFINEHAVHYLTFIPDDMEFMVVKDDKDNYCGFAAFICDSITAEIWLLVIEEKYRGQGFEDFLLQNLEQKLIALGAKFARCIVPLEGETYELLCRAEYELFEDEPMHAVPFAALHYSSFFRKKIEEVEPSAARTLDRLSAYELKALQQFLKDKKVRSEGAVRNAFSSVICDGRTIRAVMLCDCVPGCIVIRYLYSENEHSEYLLDCFRASCRLIGYYLRRDADLYLSFDTGDERETRLLKYLAGDLIEPKEITRRAIAVKRL